MNKKIILSLFILLSSTSYSQKNKPKVDKIWTENIHQFTTPILSLKSQDYSDLDFLEPLLKGKPYVFIGESSHEVNEYYLLRNRLVQYLYQELGYKVVAIEAYKLVCMEANNVRNEVSLDSLYNYCFPLKKDMTMPEGARLFLDFFKNSDIQYNGFDIDLEFPNRFQQLVKKQFPLVLDSILSLDSALTLNFNKRKGLEFKAWDDILNDSIIFPLNSKRDKEVYQAILHRRNWLYKMQVNSPHTRDSIMGRNMNDILTRFYPDEKVVFLAHNGHISKYDPKREVMGEYIHDSLRSKTYVLGLYAYQGKTGVRDNGPVELVKQKKNSLGAILNSADHEIVFTDFSQQTEKPENSWMFEQIQSVSWAFQRQKIIPSKRYDGIIQIRNITATKLKHLQYEK
ncbi:erythromycin esterase family protein [Lentimicrobium sp. S6]|uniref:erythromycin esterase family protein n=1 Tax=Lentimicrobium sp. S6 TaxID=2735872 RepID=UPI0015525A22|nr:erythromycin esterase family protein [Lentimicrobium sp. S6]NPD47539.1 erythromycin esterase family protein [Lentimicrobium sp. S6]